MNEKIDLKNRDVIIKLVAGAVCALELFILLITLIYQQDTIKRVETPITEEMAQVYINHPEKLKSDERLALNVYSSRDSQRTYLLVKEDEVVIPFPWKAWILISAGVPIGLAFLVLLLTKAYLQVLESGEKEPDAGSGGFASTVNKLSQINIIWFMLMTIVVLFLLWYIPEIVKYTGNVAVIWLTNHWWVPATIFFVAVFIVLLMIFLQYRLKVKAMHTEVEIAKLKLLQFEGNHQILLDDQTGRAPHLIEATPHEDTPS